MNDNHVQQIFAHYIDKFEYINNQNHQEYYKWQITKRFRPEMDDALDAPTEEFSTKLYAVKKLTSNLIDSYTQPFHGLVKFAEHEPETVRNMFTMLFDGNRDNLQERAQSFLTQSHALREKYYPDSYLYKEDMHSVTGYLFLYDPEHNYIYKATHARDFADCVEFYDEWGTGADTRLDIYYRMCDQLVAAIKASKELLATDASRFENGWGENPDTFHPDTEKHILAFDLIYCCSTYGLFKGISFERPKTKERQLMQERKDKAVRLSQQLEKAKQDSEELKVALEYVDSVYTVGCAIHHKKYGDGIIKGKKDTMVTVEFPDVGERQLESITLVVHGIGSVNVPNYESTVEKYQPILKERTSIDSRLKSAQREFIPYAQYL